jgi:5'-methylthioadenosine phosphorylase
MKIGVIGGSGLYSMEGLGETTKMLVDTPFGAPSHEYVHGTLGKHDVYFLPRHGVGHRLMPSEINHRANIYGLKELGVEAVISITAVGSLREDYRPRDVVLPDQYYDRTKQSGAHTFFGDGIVGHVGFGDPVCANLRSAIEQATEAVLQGNIANTPGSDLPSLHVGGTYVCMEGPAFSTRAESNIYRKLGCDLIGMTSLPEARLCREAELCYQCISMVTDYDCWHPESASVSVDMVVAHMQANALLAQSILREVMQQDLQGLASCSCRDALSTAIATNHAVIPSETLNRLRLLLGKYIKG